MQYVHRVLNLRLIYHLNEEIMPTKEITLKREFLD
jgi:hypothetical protein